MITPLPNDFPVIFTIIEWVMLGIAAPLMVLGAWVVGYLMWKGLRK